MRGVHRIVFLGDSSTTLRDVALNAGARRVVLCTQQVHDSHGNDALKTPGQNLTRYSEWLLTKNAGGRDAGDIHAWLPRIIPLTRL